MRNLSHRVVGPLVLAASLLLADRPVGAQSGAVEPWQIITPPQASMVFGLDGSVIGTMGPARRFSVPLASLPPYLGQAFVAVEDKRFYQHDGVDLVGIAGALKDAVVTGDVRGASTITQLLVGNMHPDIIDRRDRSPVRKLREQQAAREMEKHFSKQQILEAFLNQIPFGRGAFGIEMAARQYFGKAAADLGTARGSVPGRDAQEPGPIRSGALSRAEPDPAQHGARAHGRAGVHHPGAACGGAA